VTRRPGRLGRKAPQKPVYQISGARRGVRDDVNSRTRRYLISMGIRSVCFVLAVVTHGWIRWVLIFLAIVLSLIPHDMMYGPQAALIAESFTGRLRYSGASLGYQLASVIAGGPAPLIATWLFIKYNSAYAVAAYILVCAVLSLIATAMMKDYTGKDIEGEYE